MFGEANACIHYETKSDQSPDTRRTKATRRTLTKIGACLHTCMVFTGAKEAGGPGWLLT